MLSTRNLMIFSRSKPPREDLLESKQTAEAKRDSTNDSNMQRASFKVKVLRRRLTPSLSRPLALARGGQVCCGSFAPTEEHGTKA